MINVSKFTKYTNILFFLTIVTVIFTSYFTFNQVLSAHGKRQQETIIPLYSLLTKELIRPLLVGQYMANDEFLFDFVKQEQPDMSAILRYLNRISRTFNVLTFVALEDHNVVIDSDGKRIDLKNGKAEWYHRLKDSPKETITDIGNFEDPHLYIDIKLRDIDDRFLGFVGVGIKLTDYKRLFTEYHSRFAYDIILTDENDFVMLSSSDLMTTESHHRTERKVNINTLPWFNEYQQQEAENIDVKNTTITDFSTKSYSVSKMPMSELSWNLFIVSEQAENQREYWKLFIEKSAFMLFVLLVIYLVFTTSMRYINRKLVENAERDQLTLLPNRHYLNRMYAKTCRQYRSAAVIMCDLDDFKPINDKYGHKAGDMVLKAVAEKLAENIRSIDIIARWGGEEFVMVMPETSASQATEIADRIRLSIKQTSIFIEEQQLELSVTMSFGIAITDLEDDNPDKIIALADDALYDAKRCGKNCIKVN